MKKPTFIRASITGFQGKPCTLVSIFAPDRNILMAAKILPYQKFRDADDYILISNDKNADRDSLFRDDMIMEGVRAYYQRRNSQTARNTESLRFESAVAIANPSSVIEQDGMDAHGLKYRISDMTNAHVGLLATCLYVEEAESIGRVFEMNDTLARLMAGDIVTI
jgi:hypothetical protein